MQEFISQVKSELSYLNLEEKETDENYIYVLQGERDSDSIRIEFDEPNTEERERSVASGTTKEKVWNNMTYRVFINGSNPDRENTYHFDRLNSAVTWEKEISRFLKCIMGAVS